RAQSRRGRNYQSLPSIAARQQANDARQLWGAASSTPWTHTAGRDISSPQTHDPAQSPLRIAGSHGRPPLRCPAHHAQPARPDPRPRRLHHRRALLQDAAPRRRPRARRVPQARRQQGPRHRHRRRLVGRQGAPDPQARQLAVRRRRLLPLLHPRDERLPHHPRLQCPQRLPLHHLWRDGLDPRPEHRHLGPRAQLQRPRGHGRRAGRGAGGERRAPVRRERAGYEDAGLPAGGCRCPRRREQAAADPGHLATGRNRSAQRFCRVQLSGRLADAHLHHPPGGRRQADPVRLHLRLRPQRHPRAADDVLLERAVGKGQGQAQGGSRPGQGQLDVDVYADADEGPDNPAPRLERLRPGLFAPGLEPRCIGYYHLLICKKP
ncbi:hypothetical protein TCAP_06117, partial [Tolypocladium capitatum]